MAVDTLEEYQRKYQEALDRVTQSLDARKNRLFDPTLLAMAEGFLAPTRTGSFGESLGIAAGKIRGAEEAEFKREQELAQAQLGLAQQGMQLEQQRARQRFLTGMMPGAAPSGAPPQPGAQPPGQPTVPPGAQPATPMGAPAGAAQPLGQPGAAQLPAGSQAAVAQQPPGTEGIKGEPFMPPNPNIANRVNFLRAAMMDPSKGVLDLAKELEDLERKRYQENPEGIVDLVTGLLYRTKKPDIAPVAVQLRTIQGLEGQTINVPATVARDLANALSEAMSGNPARLRQLEQSLVRSYAEQPAAPSQGAPSGPGRVMTSQELETSAAEEKELALGRAKTAVEKEKQVTANTAAARSMLFNANRVQQLVSQSPQGFGIFSRPGIASAIGNMINEGIKAGTTSVNLGGFENSVRQLMPNMSQKDLDNVGQVGGALAETELAFRILFMRGQGAVTEGEGAIVRNIGGNISQSPGVLMQKAKLIAMRAQHDINIGEAWGRYQEQNPKASYNQFERSPLYKKLITDYDQNLANAFGVKPPAQQPGDATASKPKFIIRPVGGQ
jgi:hypothetical protein